MKIRIFAAADMKKLIFFIVLFLLTGANSAVTSFTTNDDSSAVEIPLEETKDVLEEDDDDAGLEHFWHSRETSSDSNLHFLYQEILFHDLDLEIAVPPPKA